MAYSWKMAKGPDSTLDLQHIEKEGLTGTLHGTTNDYAVLLKDDAEVAILPIWFDSSRKFWKDKCSE